MGRHDEIDRRFAAVRAHWQIDDAELVDGHGRPILATNSGTHSPFMLAKRGPDGTLRPAPDVKTIFAHIREHDIGFFIIDPIVEFHEGEENDNVQMKLVWGAARSIAEPSHRLLDDAKHLSA